MKRRTVLMMSVVFALAGLFPASQAPAQVLQKPLEYWNRWLFTYDLMFGEPKIIAVLNLTDEQAKQVDAMYEKVLNSESLKALKTKSPAEYNDALDEARKQMKEQCKDILKPEQWALVDKLNTAAREAVKTVYEDAGIPEKERHNKAVVAVATKLAEVLTPEQKALLAKAKAQ